jgi:hypothetical protein
MSFTMERMGGWVDENSSLTFVPFINSGIATTK